jgi:exo-1,4-beta-D-glucosaminidase
VELVAGETRLVSFSPPEFAQLEFQNPRLWWPYQYGNPELYELDLSFEVGGQVSDSLIQRFGIREMGSEFTDEGHRVFTVNGQRVLVRGAGWAPDMMFRPSPEREMQDVRFVKDMNLNAIRLEGKFESDVLLDACDEQGILVIAGWCCCDHWEHWDDWTAEDHSVAEDSLRSQVRRLRNHPSLLSWWNSSDMPPPRDVEQSYIDVLTDLDWRVPYVSSASEQPSDLTGPSGVKMNGPYDYVPPNYWWLDTENGGAWGFNTEAGPGPAIPGVESLKRFLGNDHLWPIDSYWEFHAGGGQFANVDLFTGALNARFGTATSLEDYVLKAQVSSYEGQRAMFEAFRRKKYTATGIVHWMLNNGWPSIIWHLYDYYHATGGGYFGTKKANEPLHVLYAYDDRAIVIANETNQPYDNLLATASVFNLDMTKMGEQQATVSVAPDGVANAFTLTSYTGLSSTYFVRLTLETPDQNLVSDNLYWLSTSPDVLNWNGSSWYHTPVSRHADLTALETLPSASVDVTASIDQNTERTLTVKVKNTGTSLAFFLELRVTQGDQGTEVLPTLWSDNYVSILPGEERTLTALFAGDKLGGAEPFVQVQGWNVPKRAISAAN